MRKKLQTYQGVIAYKADKTPVKRVFYGRSKAEAKAKYFAYIAEHGQAEKCSDLYTCLLYTSQDRELRYDRGREGKLQSAVAVCGAGEKHRANRDEN